MEVKNTPVVYFPNKIEVTSVSTIQDNEPPDKQLHEVEFPERISKELLTDKVEDMNEFLESTSTALKFRLHEKLDVYYVQIINTQTEEVLKEIPNKKFLDMYASIAEITGLLVDEKR